MKRSKWILLNTLMWIFSILGSVMLLMSLITRDVLDAGITNIMRIIGLVSVGAYLIVFKPVLDETKRRKHKDLH